MIRTKCLKKLIAETFPEETKFNFALGLHVSPFTLHASNVNPTNYALASLVEALKIWDIADTWQRLVVCGESIQ